MTGIHPPAPRTVCVLGGGPSGLTVARRLERAGHRAIVLEARADVGGKCDSVEIDGKAYDLGGHICTTAYENLAQLVTELGVSTEDTTPHRVYDLLATDIRPQSAQFFRADKFRRYAALRANEFPHIADPGLGHSARALSAPVRQWLAEHDLQTLADDLGVGYTGAGYGYLDAELPALYFVKYAELTGLLSNRPELLGHAGSFTIKGGFSSLWQLVAAELDDVRRNAHVESIRRTAGGVQISTSEGVIQADDLVITIPLDQALPLLDASDEERDLAGRVRHIDYYTTVATISGLPRSAFYLLRQPSESSAMRGHCVSYHHRYPETDVFTCYSYGDSGIDEGDIEALLRDDVRRLGGHVERVHVQRRWAFMPHFDGDDLRAGIYDRIEAAQGRRHTYYAGGLPAYETVESNVAYSNQLVDRFFQPASDRRAQAHGVPSAPAAGFHAPSAATTTDSAPPLSGPRVTADEVRCWLTAHIAAELGRPESAVDADTPLERYALESLSIAAIHAQLSDWLGYRVPHRLFLELPTIEAMAIHLATDEQDASEPAEAHSAVGRQPTHLLMLTPARPFYCVGGAVGAAYYLRPLARAIGGAHPFYGLQAPGLAGTDEPLDQVEELAAFHLDQIRRLQRHGPYQIGGHSFGGLVAYEMGRRLLEAGEQVSQVMLLDTYIPIAGQVAPPADEFAAIEELLLMNRLTHRSDTAEDVVINPDTPISRQRQLLAKALGATGALPIEEHIVNMLRVYQGNLDAFVEYQPTPTELPVTLFKARDGFPQVLKGDRQVLLHIDDPDNGWGHAGLQNLHTVEVPGDHFSMFAHPNLQTLAGELRQRLDTAGD